MFLGCRDFESASVPPKSRLGNKITRAVFRLFHGIKITDTQTGLRGFTNEVLADILTLAGEHFEYETNVLLWAHRKQIPIYELPIETVYVNGNRETHFDAIRDSIRIYAVIFKQFFRFSAVSIASFLIDIVFFALFEQIFQNVFPTYHIIVATILARAVSSVFNYVFNRRVVFSDASVRHNALLRYYMLCVCQALCSAVLVRGLARAIPIAAVFCKLPVDTLLYFVSFRIQKGWVFRGEEGR